MLHDMITRRLAEASDVPAIYLSDAVHSYGSMAGDIERWSSWLTQRGLPRHARVLISVGDPYLFAVLFFALEKCALTSVCSTSLIEPTAQRLAFLDVAAVISEKRPSKDVFVSWIAVGPDWSNYFQSIEHAPAPEIDRRKDDPVCILLSSGTTGVAKKVLLTRDVLEARISNFAHIRLMGPSRRALCVIPYYLVAGLSTMLYALDAGGSVTYPIEQAEWVKLFRRRTFDAILAAPSHLLSILAALPPDWQPDETLTVTVGGGAPSPALLHQLRSRLTSNIYLAYGSTEIGVITQCHIDEVAGAAEAAGFPVSTTNVQIVDEQDQRVADGQAGQIRVAGSGVVKGYADDPVATVRSFRDGWYYPGDIGRLDQNGSLAVLGRVDDLMTLNGAKLLPSLVEDRIMLAAPGIELAVFAAVAPGDAGESLWVAGAQPLPHDAVKTLAPFSRLTTIRRSVVNPLPRNAMGKIDRVALRRAAAAGDLPSRTATFVVRESTLAE
jgi:acyl-CoA synthetase (AMP-forming)/AMP-acid ligase II